MDSKPEKSGVIKFNTLLEIPRERNDSEAWILREKGENKSKHNINLWILIVEHYAIKNQKYPILGTNKKAPFQFSV